MENYTNDQELQTYFSTTLAEDPAFTAASAALGLNDGQFAIASDISRYGGPGDSIM
jgi:hypothetical protein